MYWFINQTKHFLKYNCTFPSSVNYSTIIIYMYQYITCVRIFWAENFWSGKIRQKFLLRMSILWYEVLKESNIVGKKKEIDLYLLTRKVFKKQMYIQYKPDFIKILIVRRIYVCIFIKLRSKLYQIVSQER